ncbi:hypothetical protein [uncultured Chryseobacterium sp.]|uniref:hypothetical protein n=1 Tax=uncultured Chryseobacterium sp. TaxID=259322 RepID=UPI0025E6BE7F|nr:hypothetical protein [uncultured Chryseobacterium sp.]
MTIKFFIFLFLTLSIRIFSQEPEKVTFKDTQNFYYKIVPEGKPAGLIMVLPGGGETPEKVMNQITWMNLLLRKIYLLFFPVLKTVISKWKPSGNSWTALQKIWWKNTKYPKIKL